MNLLRMGSIRNNRRSIWMGLLNVILSLFVVGLTVIPVSVAATDFVREISYNLEQPISGKTSIVSAGEYLQLVYQLALGLVGIIAVVIIMFGGLLWVQAAGNEQSISKAKELIISAVVGLLIALLSYTILAFVNPETLRINFSVSRINPIFEETNLLELTPCNDGKFDTEVCIDETGESIECEKIQCGQRGFFDGDYCAGRGCGAGTGRCFPSPTDPYNSLACRPVRCGNWINRCKNSRIQSGEYGIVSSDDGKQRATRNCICDYYEETLVENDSVFNVPDAYNYSIHNGNPSDDQTQTLFELCYDGGEGGEEYWLADNPALSDGPGYDCVFNCKLSIHTGTIQNLNPGTNCIGQEF